MIYIKNELKIMPNKTDGIDVFLNEEKINSVIAYTIEEEKGKKIATLKIAVSKIEIES